MTPIPGPVVFIGDSITEQWAVHRPALFSDHSFVNRGIGGETTSKIRARFADEIRRCNAGGVHLLCGINDIAGIAGAVSLADIQSNLAAMIDEAALLGCPLLAGSVTPAEFNWLPQERPAKTIEALNRWLRDYATSRGSLYVDYHALLRARDGRLKPRFQIDGLHLSPAGYQEIEPLLLRALAPRVSDLKGARRSPVDVFRQWLNRFAR